MIFTIIRLITFRNQLLKLKEENTRVAINLETDVLQKVSIKSVGLFSATLSYDNLDLDEDVLFDLNDGEEWISLRGEEEGVLYEDTILISDIKLITTRTLESLNVEEKKKKLNKLL